MGLRHVVVLTLDSRCDVDAIVEALRALPASIPELRSYVVGRDAGMSPGNATLAVVADVDDEAAFVGFRNHPEHLRVLHDLIQPHIVGRAAVQHWT